MFSLIFINMLKMKQDNTSLASSLKHNNNTKDMKFGISKLFITLMMIVHFLLLESVGQIEAGNLWCGFTFSWSRELLFRGALIDLNTVDVTGQDSIIHDDEGIKKHAPVGQSTALMVFTHCRAVRVLPSGGNKMFSLTWVKN